MNEQLKQQIEELLKTGIDFANQEISQITREYLTYHFWDSIFRIVCGLLCGAAALYCYKLFKECDDSYNDRDKCLWSGFIGIVFAIYSVLSVGCSLSDAIKIKVAPRIYLIDAVSSRIKECK